MLNHCKTRGNDDAAHATINFFHAVDLNNDCNERIFVRHIARSNDKNG